MRDDNYVSRDGALTRATSKDYDEFARRMPPTTAMAKINDPVLCSPGLCLCMCKLHLPLLLVGVKRITVVHGCIRYAILRTKLAVVEVVRGHCAMNHKKSAGGSAREKTHSSIHTYVHNMQTKMYMRFVHTYIPAPVFLPFPVSHIKWKNYFQIFLLLNKLAKLQFTLHCKMYAKKSADCSSNINMYVCMHVQT